MDNLKPTYDTETVRQLLGLPNAQTVRELTRRGKALYSALIRGGARGRYDPYKVRRVRMQMIRRRLAETLGRISPRFLDESHSCACSECEGIAVEWEGQILCENGHRSNSVAES